MKGFLVAAVLAGTLVSLSPVPAQAGPDIPACTRAGTELVVAALAATSDDLGAAFPHVTDARHSLTRCGTSIVDDLDAALTVLASGGLHEPVVDAARGLLDTVEDEGDRRQFFLQLILCIDLELCD